MLPCPTGGAKLISCRHLAKHMVGLAPRQVIRNGDSGCIRLVAVPRIDTGHDGDVIGWRPGGRLSKIALTMLNIVEFMPIPSARVTTAIAVNPEFFTNCLM